MNNLEQFYYLNDIKYNGCFVGLKTIIMQYDPNIIHSLKYNLPFFSFQDKMMCYLSIHKKLNMPYIGWADGYKLKHVNLISENRSRIKILLIDSNKDLPLKVIQEILSEAISLKAAKA